MLIEEISGTKGLFDKELKALAVFLEDFPFECKDTLILAKRFDLSVAPNFHALFDPLYESYSQYVSSYGLSEFIEFFKESDPNQFFMLNRKETIDAEELIARAIYIDARPYFYSVDNFIGLEKEGYAVPTRLELPLDKYGLVPVDKDFRFMGQGIVYKEKDLLFYHPFLRRYFTSNFTEITKRIADLSLLKNSKLELALDPLRSNIKESLHGEIFEFDHWRGPKFNLDKLNDRNFVGPTVYKRISNENDFSWPVDRIEAVVGNQGDDEKTLTIQEINPTDDMLESDERYAVGKHFMQYSEKYRLSKFAHFIWDKKTQNFNHLDIAVIAYPKEEFQKRFDLEFPDRNAVPKADKIKLVRVDGAISLDIVQGLIGDFFRYNELIQEFFDGK